MLNKNIRISDLQIFLDSKLGKGNWAHLEPGTILIEFGCKEYLVAEKIFILKALNTDLNSAISLPEFLLWACSVCNNNYAEFETLHLPTCLELAWCIEEVKRIGHLTGQVFKPSEELIDVVAYLLRLEGFSHCPSPFEFVPETKLEPGQTNEDMAMKTMAIKAYVKHMSEESIGEPA